ncbi:MAG: GDSL-type esterase/lipase family protein [Ignavibacteria bacterium]|nr:GDSL-type esterase/lipase family protein [Ignavibacteria bacterium]
MKAKKVIVNFVLFISIFTFRGNLMKHEQDQSKKDALFHKNLNYKLQTDLYDIYKTKQADIVMLGNSITFGVDWSELLNRKDVVNRGIGGDYTEGMLNRIQYVYKVKPQICFIMAGINDIYENIPVETIFNNYKKIIEGLKKNLIIPVIQSTLYVSDKWIFSKEKNLEVQKLNSLLKNYAKENKIEFLDLNSKLADEMKLKDEYTYDGVHLTAKAYEIWGKEVDKILGKYGF